MVVIIFLFLVATESVTGKPQCNCVSPEPLLQPEPSGWTWENASIVYSQNIPKPDNVIDEGIILKWSFGEDLSVNDCVSYFSLTMTVNSSTTTLVFDAPALISDLPTNYTIITGTNLQEDALTHYLYVNNTTFIFRFTMTYNLTINSTASQVKTVINEVSVTWYRGRSASDLTGLMVVLIVVIVGVLIVLLFVALGGSSRGGKSNTSGNCRGGNINEFIRNSMRDQRCDAEFRAIYGMSPQEYLKRTQKR